jgi:hypothetical protein
MFLSSSISRLIDIHHHCPNNQNIRFAELDNRKIQNSKSMFFQDTSLINSGIRKAYKKGAVSIVKIQMNINTYKKSLPLERSGTPPGAGEVQGDGCGAIKR